MNKQDLQLLNIEVGTFKRADNQLTGQVQNVGVN